MERRCGILMHISSLPGPDGIGALGQEAYDFADFLHRCGVRIWQVLPMGPTGYGESPYQSASVFAGNPMLISTSQLVKDGILSSASDPEWSEPECEKVSFDAMRAHKERLLRRAFAESGKRLAQEVAGYRGQMPWLRDFALFTALKARFGGVMWTQWPDVEIRLRKPYAISRWTRELEEEIAYHEFCQYLFNRQWTALKAYCNGLDIRLFGDMPIYVAEDSADTWTRPEVFQLDKNRVPRRVAGVPPDLFSEDGQLWGNPLYRWTSLRLHGYGWWVERMAHMQRMYDLIRIDHFIGFANYYSIPYGAPNARTGKWVIGPGKALFRTFNRKLPGLDIIAEDLGAVNDRVRKLLRFVGYPGMKVLSFGFGGGADNPHALQNWGTNCVAYTGTHDNDTVLGYLTACSDAERDDARRQLGFTSLEEAPAAFVRAVMLSPADTAVIPMQDILGLDGSARMNLPGTIGGNWAWRLRPDAVNPEVESFIHGLVKESNR